MKHSHWRVFLYWSLIAASLFTAACGTIRSHRLLEQPVGPQLTTSIGGIVFRLNKQGDLPNAYGGRDIWGGKVDKGFAEMKLVGVENQTIILDVVDISRQSSETVMDRYKPFQQRGVVNVDVQQPVNVDLSAAITPTRIRLNIEKQRYIIISGIRVNFVEVQPYSVRYTLEDLQPQPQ